MKTVQYLLALLAGGVIHLSFAPYNYWLTALAGMLIFAGLITTTNNRKKIFWLAFSFATGLFGAGISWVYVSIHTYGEVPAPLALFFTAGFVFALTQLFVLPWLLLPLLAKSRPLKFLVFPILWLIGEWLRSWVLTGFPWLYLGYGQVEAPLSGWLPIIGVLGVSTLIAVVSALLAYILMLCFTGKSNQRSTLVSAAIILSIFLIGAVFNKTQWTQQLDANIPVTLVQPDIPLRDKWNPFKAKSILETLENQSEGAWNPGLLIWPEAAIPYVGNDADAYVEFLDALGSASGAAVVSGLLTYDSEQDRYLNSIIGLGAANAVYHKQRLVPFGEYVPLENWLRGTMQFFNLPMSVITRGPANQQPLNFDYLGKNYSLAPALCYEITYSNLVRKMARDANLIVTLSNDAWFGASIGPQQHMQIAQARALENQKPLIRVTNNGITALVDYKGAIYDALPQFTTAHLQSVISPRTGSTPYALAGNLPLAILSLVIGILALVYSRKQTL